MIPKNWVGVYTEGWGNGLGEVEPRESKWLNSKTPSLCDMMERVLRTIYPGLHPGLRYYATSWLQKALKGRHTIARGGAPGIELPQ